MLFMLSGIVIKSTYQDAGLRCVPRFELVLCVGRILNIVQMHAI